jgi:hypothetical protein
MSYDMNLIRSLYLEFQTILLHSWCWHAVCYEFWRVGKTYPNTSCADALVPPPRPILRCDHDEEGNVKQSRHPTMTARAYYCCPYQSLSIKFSSWIQLIQVFENNCQCDWKKTKFCRVRASAVYSSGSTTLRCGTHKFFFSRMIEVSLFRITVSSVGFPHHQIHLQWQMRRRKQLLIVFATHLFVQMCTCTVLSWRICLLGWITHQFCVVIFLYR